MTDFKVSGPNDVSDDQLPPPEGEQVPPKMPPVQEQSLELPAVIIGDRGDDDDRLEVRLLPGRIPKSLVLYPVYAAVGLAALLATHFSLRTGEWHPLMPLLGWGLLYCWYWVYGVAYRYRRWMMKFFALFMATVTAASLALVASVRSASMAVPTGEGLQLRPDQPILVAVTVLTLASLAAIYLHVIYLGRGYRQKRLHGNNDRSH